MLLEERQRISNYATLRVPVGTRIPKPVILLGLHLLMILIAIATLEWTCD
jgi:hypothetical protein